MSRYWSNKPLVWVESNCLSEAKTPHGTYRVVISEDGFWKTVINGATIHHASIIWGHLSEAKAAAQADYERREREAEALAAGRQMTYAEAVLRHAPPMNDVETCLFIIEQMADDLFNATGQITDAERALRLAASRIREWRPA